MASNLAAASPTKGLSSQLGIGNDEAILVGVHPVSRPEQHAGKGNRDVALTPTRLDAAPRERSESLDSDVDRLQFARIAYRSVHDHAGPVVLIGQEGETIADERAVPGTRAVYDQHPARSGLIESSRHQGVIANRRYGRDGPGERFPEPEVAEDRFGDTNGLAVLIAEVCGSEEHAGIVARRAENRSCRTGFAQRDAATGVSCPGD